jgi:hypothetical protein
MLTALLTVLNIKCPSVVYANSPSLTSDCKIEIVTRFDTDYFFIESFKKQSKFNCNTKSYNTN